MPGGSHGTVSLEIRQQLHLCAERGGKKEENKYRFAFPQMEGNAISSHGTFHSTFLEPRDFFRVDTYKQLCQRPGSLRHQIPLLGA